MKPPAQSLKDQFLAWQCRIRQIAMREDGGRPSPGMRPRLLDARGKEMAKVLTVLIVPRDPSESTDFFRFQAMKTADPRDLYERALAYLQADYFQKPEAFSEELLAVLPEGSDFAAALVAAGSCVLEFEQFSQAYRLPSSVRELRRNDPAREAAIWHNCVFNPALPETVHVVALKPDWASAKALSRPDGQKTVPL